MDLSPISRRNYNNDKTVLEMILSRSESLQMFDFSAGVAELQNKTTIVTVKGGVMQYSYGLGVFFLIT